MKRKIIALMTIVSMSISGIANISHAEEVVNAACTQPLSNRLASAYNKEQLNGLGKDILDNLKMQNTCFNVAYSGSPSPSLVENELENLKYNHPLETYNLVHHQENYSQSNDNLNIQITCKYIVSHEQYAELDKKAQEIVNKIILDNMSTLEKEEAIHDWIVDNTTYDETHKIYDPYNTLMKHTGVCEGYALLAQKMFTLVGIRSMVVEGYANGGAHAWNLVNIDNKWRHVDCTWDDPICKNGKSKLSRDYFNLTDTEISKDHTIWNKDKYPRAE